MAARRCAVLRVGVVLALGAAAVAGCTVNAAAPDSSPVGTVGDVGKLPGSFGSPVTQAEDEVVPESEPEIDAEVVVTDSAAPSTETTLAPPAVIGTKVIGNRLLIIGDSLTASISARYGGQTCDVLVPLGWEVEVDAETGRFIDFGARVLDKRLAAGWDAAVLFLGNNYGEDRGVYQLALHSLLLRLHPRPTVLITTALFRPQQAEVNDSILEEAAMFDDVTVLDWQTISGEDPSLTGDDGLHLSESGRVRLGAELAAVMGAAPKQPGKCLSTNYHDDSAGSPSGPSGNSTTTKTTTRTTTKTTTKPTATTRPAVTTTSVRPTGTTAASTTIPTATTATTPVATVPVVTVPVTTPPSASPTTTSPQPPTTASASTAPPTTAAQAPPP
ncbi:MAG: hypothetical protein ABIW84_06225 [Ilumatobacteraceae bacterium]